MKEKQPSAADVTRVGIRWIALLALFCSVLHRIGPALNRNLMFCRGVRSVSDNDSALSKNETSISERIKMSFCNTGMEIEMFCNLICRHVLICLKEEKQYLFAFFVEPIFLKARILKLIFKIYYLQLQNLILRNRLRQAFFEKEVLFRKQTELLLKKVNHVLGKSGSRGDADEVLCKVSGAHKCDIFLANVRDHRCLPDGAAGAEGGEQ
jgi:hypothetical protein